LPSLDYVLSSSAANGNTSTVLQRKWLTEVDPLAVCNDGTPGAYYYSPAIENGKSTDLP